MRSVSTAAVLLQLALSLVGSPADAWLLATISHDAVGAGTTQLFLQIGANGINNAGESTSQISVVFGAVTDPGLNGSSEREVDSLTADASVTVDTQVPLDPPQQVADGAMPVEYSNAFDEQAAVGGGHGAVDVWLAHGELNSGDPARGLDDVDALELWGRIGAEDADYFSLAEDAAHGTSVFLHHNGASQPFVSHPEIVNAVESLGYAGEPDLIDVDALMVRNVDTPETFEAGDVLLFSIRAVPEAGFGGHEIIVLPAGGPASFLLHGGHEWDPNFVLVDADGNPADVDALEAAPLVLPVPALGWAMRALLILLVGGAALFGVRRRLA